MTTYQEQSQGRIVIGPQSTKGTALAAGSANAYELPVVSFSDSLTKAAISSNQIRGDGQPTRGRHAQKGFTASMKGELQQTNFDGLFSALLRTTWTTNPVVTDATGAMSSATLSATGSVITFSGGSVITAGIRVYDVLMFTAGLAVADTNRPLRVMSLTATTITVAETLTTVAGPVSTYSFSAHRKKLVSPAAGAATKVYHTIERYEQAIDITHRFDDVIVSRFALNLSPTAMVSADFDFVGTGAVTALSGANAPYFTAYTSTAKTVLSPLDATISFGGVDVADVQSLSLTVDYGAQPVSVVGASVSPDVFLGVPKISMNMTVCRKSDVNFAGFLAETSYALNLLFVVPGTSPSEFVSITIPYFTLGSDGIGELRRDAGVTTETLNVPDALVGIDIGATASGYDQTPIKIQVTNT